jgi:L-fuculose-phosphate aldolase
MGEQYVGVKFRTRFASREPPTNEQTGELVAWCRRLAQLGLAPDGAGNLSCRSRRGFVISRTGADLATITPDEVVEVLEVDRARAEVVVSGIYEPSSESLLHSAIYEARHEIGAVFHGHNENLLHAVDRLGVPVTAREQPYGTPQLVEEAMPLLVAHDLFALRGHGIVSVGPTPSDAGRRLERLLTAL